MMFLRYVSCVAFSAFFFVFICGACVWRSSRGVRFAFGSGSLSAFLSELAGFLWVGGSGRWGILFCF